MLVPIDLPQRCSDAGLEVYVLDGWESYGAAADHGALVFHWTASSASQSPSSCANYCAYNDGYPHYNVLVGRDGSVWFLAREKAESSGQISGVALNEALSGQANVASAASRGLSDTTSANNRLWAISAQNDGVGEPWSEQLINAMATVCALSLQSLGLGVYHLQHHCGLTARKIDLTPRYGCPDRHEWYARIEAAMHGGGRPTPEEPEVWIIDRQLEEGEVALVALPHDRKSAHVRLLCRDEKGAATWASQSAAGDIGLWAGGNDWEVWVPRNHPVDADVSPDSFFVTVENRGPGVLMVATYGT